jgi:hypothetical protein
LCDVNPLAFNREVYAKSVAFWDANAVLADD